MSPFPSDAAVTTLILRLGMGVAFIYLGLTQKLGTPAQSLAGVGVVHHGCGTVVVRQLDWPAGGLRAEDGRPGRVRRGTLLSTRTVSALLCIKDFERVARVTRQGWKTPAGRSLSGGSRRNAGPRGGARPRSMSSLQVSSTARNVPRYRGTRLSEQCEYKLCDRRPESRKRKGTVDEARTCNKRSGLTDPDGRVVGVGATSLTVLPRGNNTHIIPDSHNCCAAGTILPPVLQFQPEKRVLLHH